MCSLCASIRWVSSLLFSIVFMWFYGSSNWTESTLGLWWVIVDLEGDDIEVWIFLLKSLGIDPCLLLLWSSCSLDSFYWLKMVTWKGMSPNLPLLCINSYITTLLLSPNPWQSSFRCWIEDFPGILKNKYWYYLHVVLLTCWRWFGPFRRLKSSSKFMLTIVLIMEWAVYMYTSVVSRVSKTYLIVNLNVV